MTATEPVRDLYCSYDTLKRRPLSCEWREPKQWIAPIKFYQVNVIRNGRVIRRLTTKTSKFNAKAKLSQRKIYTVSVRVVAPREGALAKTRVNFTNSGKSNFIC